MTEASVRGTARVARVLGCALLLAFAGCSRGADLSGKSVDEMVEVLRGGDADDRRAAVEALAAVGLGGGHGLFEALLDPAESVRTAAESAVAQLGVTGQQLAASSADETDPRVRAGAALAMPQTGLAFSSAEPLLRQGLEDDYPLVRAAAASAIGAYGGPARGFVSTLADLSRRDVLEVQVAAARSLWRMTGSSEVALPALMRGLGDESSAVRLSAIEGLVAMRGDAYDASKKLMTLASTDDDERVREAAGEAIKAVKR